MAEHISSKESVIDFEGRSYNETFLEIADCRHKIRLHITSDDTKADYVKKLKLLSKEIELFINHLESFTK